MKTVLIIIVVMGFAQPIFAQDSSVVIPVKIIRTSPDQPYQKDTVYMNAFSKITAESEKEMRTKLLDTAYLDQIAGKYLKNSDSKTELKITRRDKTLFILIPGFTEAELIPMNSYFFRLKERPATKIFLYYDRKGITNGINIHSEKENYAATREKL